MSKKQTARLSLLTFVFVITIAFVFAMAYAPTVASANAAGTISTVNGEAYTPGSFVEVPYTGNGGVTLTIESTPAYSYIDYLNMVNGAPDSSLGPQAPSELGEYCARLHDDDNNVIGDVFFRIVLADMTDVSVVQNGTLTYTAEAQTASVNASATTADGSDPVFKYSLTSGSGYDDTVPSFTEAGNHTVYYKVTAPNHNDATGSFTVTIGKAPLTITAQDKATTYGSAAPLFNVVCAGFVGGQNEGYLNGSISLSCAYDTTDPDHRNAGEYDIVPSGYTSDNYEIGFVKGTLTVAPKTLTVTANDHTIGYGDEPTNNGVSISGFAYGEGMSVLDGDLSYAYGYTQFGDVGSYAITPSGFTEGNYVFDYVNGTLTVQKATLTVTIDSQEVYYGNEADPFTYTITGFVNGETEQDLRDAGKLSGTLTMTSEYEPGLDLGTDSIYVEENTLVATNYEFNVVNGNINSVARPITVTIYDIAATYGDPAQTLVAAVTEGSIYNNEEAYEFSVTDGTQAVALSATTPVGCYYIVGAAVDPHYDVTFVSAGGHTLGTAIVGLYEIAAKPLTVVWDTTASWTYNGTEQNCQIASVNDIHNAPIALTVTADSPFKDKGEYTLVATMTTADSNYTLTNATYEASIAAKTLTVAWDFPQSGYVYNGANQEDALQGVASVDTGIVGETVELTVVADGLFKNAGDYLLLAYQTNVNYNYTLTNDEDIPVSILPAALTVTAKNKTVKFGNAAPAFANTDDYVEYDGLLNGDTVASLAGTLSFDCAYQTGAAAGSTFDIVPSGLTSGNYEIVFEKGVLTVAKRQLTITNKASNTPVNFVYGDASVYQLNPYDHITVGGDGIAPSDLAILQQNPLYIVALIPMGISPRDRNHPIPVQNLSGSNFGYAATYYLYVYESAINANYEATVDFDDNAKLVISPKDLTITADDKNIEYGETPEFTVSYDGFAYDDATKAKELVFSGTLAFDCDYDTSDPAKRGIKDGGYAITPKGVTAQNYNIIFNSGKLTVSKKYLLVKANDKTVTYGDAAPVFTVTYEGFVYGDDENTEGVFDDNAPLMFNCDYEVGSAVGTMSIAPTNLGSANYNVAFADGVLTIEARPLTITNTNTTPLSKVYGDPSVYQLNPYTVIGVDGLTASDLAILQGNPNYIAMLVPMGISPRDKTHPIALQELTGSNFGYAATYYLYVYETMINENYAVTVDFDENAKLVVSPKALTITAESKTITYGDAAPAFTVTYDGFVGGNYNDSEAKLTGTLAFDCDYDVSDPANRGVKASGYAITPKGVSNGNYDITFVSGVLNVDAKEITLTWGNETLVYNKTLQAPSVTVGGTVYDEIIVAEVEGKASVVGNDYVATVVALNNVNYSIPTQNSKAFAIAKKVVTVTAANKESGYGEALVALTATDTGILAGDAVYTLSTTADKNEVGTYPIVVNVNGVDKDNYDITVVNGTYTVKTNVTVTTDDNGEKVVEANKKIDDEAAKSEEGVSIKNAIQNVLSASADASAATLKVEIGEKAAVTFDKAALQKLAENADVKISYSETKAEDITDKDLKGAALVIEISLSGASFEGGKALVTATFENKAPGGKKAVVYYVDANGKKTDMKAVFADGTVSFETTHFSTYVVEYVLTGGAIAGIVIGSVVGAAGIAVGAFFLLKKKNAKKGGEKAAE